MRPKGPLEVPRGAPGPSRARTAISRVESELVRMSPAGMRGAAYRPDNADAYMPTCLICLICPTELLV